MFAKPLTMSGFALLTLIVLSSSAETLQITDPSTNDKFPQQSISVSGKGYTHPDVAPGIQVKGFGWMDDA